MDTISSGAALPQTNLVSEQSRLRMAEADKTGQARPADVPGKAAESVEDPAKTGDTVSISEAGRALQQQSAEKGPQADRGGYAIPGGADGEGEDENAADEAKESVLRQIREVKAKLDETQARLAQTQEGSSSSQAAARPAQPTGVAEEAGAAEENPAAAAQAALAGLGGAGEAETLQAQVEMLNQQLQTLYQQLMQMSQKGSEAGATGTAGLGGQATGPSGQGERIKVSA